MPLTCCQGHSLATTPTEVSGNFLTDFKKRLDMTCLAQLMVAKVLL